MAVSTRSVARWVCSSCANCLSISRLIVAKSKLEKCNRSKLSKRLFLKSRRLSEPNWKFFNLRKVQNRQREVWHRKGVEYRAKFQQTKEIKLAWQIMLYLQAMTGVLVRLNEMPSYLGSNPAVNISTRSFLRSTCPMSLKSGLVTSTGKSLQVFLWRPWQRSDSANFSLFSSTPLALIAVSQSL